MFRLPNIFGLNPVRGRLRPSYQMPDSASLPDVDALVHEGLLRIPCLDPTAEDVVRDTHRKRGQFLARQDRWDDLRDEVSRADAHRAMTPAAMPVADLLCYGARADVVTPIEHLLQNATGARRTTQSGGIEELELILAEAPSDPVRAVIIAQTHIDLGWAWRGARNASTLPFSTIDKGNSQAHFDRARCILTRLKGNCAESPLFLATLCALNVADIDQNARLPHDYEHLVDLNPMAHSSLRALGTYISPQRFGTYADLELEARRTAARTQAHWGAGGYTWVMFDALAGDPRVCANLDLDFFAEGLKDILLHLKDQHTANMMAAYCMQTMIALPSSTQQADENRAHIVDCADWIVRDHMTELHPLVWAHAAAGFENSFVIPSQMKFAAQGRQKALSSIAWLFRKELADGNQIVFTKNGPVAEHC